tara:strand:- start:6203 stop:8788 length:2586 start_codon:yes stop_codon:yes gene_type:complete
MTKSIYSNSLRTLLFAFFSTSIFSQNSDLDILEILPDDQAQSIAEKLGVQTGRPINDEVRQEDLDDPKFPSLEAKQEIQLQESQPLNNSINELPFFGYDFFKDSPTTFAPIDLAPAPLGYIVGPGDELRIQLIGLLNVNRLVPVNREGNVVIPEIGTIQINGLVFRDAVKKIIDTAKATIAGTEVEVSLAKIRSIQIFVLGNAFSPGAYTISSLSNVSNALTFSGGPSKSGSLRSISLRRNGNLIGNFDFYDFLLKGMVSSDLKIFSNDALVINPIGKIISISGAVRKEAKFELKKEEKFQDLLGFASGFSNIADKNKITLSRIAKNGERIFQNLQYSELENLILEDGDELYVHKLSNTPRNIVKVIGESTSSGNYAFEKGLTLEEIIQPKNLIDTTYTPFSIIERENLYGSKILLKANLLDNDGSGTPLKENDVIYVLSKNDVDFLNSYQVGYALGVMDEEESDRRILNDQLVNRCKSLSLLAKQSKVSSIEFVKSKYLPNPDKNPSDQLQPFNGCPQIFESNPYLIIFALENASVISGEVRKPGIYPSYMVSSPRDLLSYAGGMSEKASGEVDIFTDDGVPIKISIEDSTDLVSLGITSGFYANLSSKVQDKIFSVSLEGSFVSPGVYGVKQGERLSQLIARAGGYKENAYPYGGVLARKSVASSEKIAMLKSADQLKESIASAISSGRISSTGGDPTLALSSISSLISDLENVKPVGRVVTELDLDNLLKHPEKDLILESGDRIFIPERPSTITVSGQVLSPTSFSFNPSFKTVDYINLAGGFSEAADKSRILVIYPNGRASRVKSWPNHPDLSPGTTLVVPRDPNPFDWLVFSQVLFPIISNFATSAAAIAALGNNN